MQVERRKNETIEDGLKPAKLKINEPRVQQTQMMAFERGEETFQRCTREVPLTERQDRWAELSDKMIADRATKAAARADARIHAASEAAENRA